MNQEWNIKDMQLTSLNQENKKIKPFRLTTEAI